MPKLFRREILRQSAAVSDDNLITASAFAALEFSYEVFKRTGVKKAQTAEAGRTIWKVGAVFCSIDGVIKIDTLIAP